MRTVTIALSRPLRLKTGEIFELEMKEPTMAEEEDSMAMAVDMGRGQVPLTTEMCMYALLCNVPYSAIRSMPSVDYEKLRNAYQSFVRPTGPLMEQVGMQQQNCTSSGRGCSDLPEPRDGGVES